MAPTSYLYILCPQQSKKKKDIKKCNFSIEYIDHIFSNAPLWSELSKFLASKSNLDIDLTVIFVIVNIT